MRARVGLVIGAAGLSVLACSGSDSGTDSPTSLTYTIATLLRGPARSEPPVVFIDGVAERVLAVKYPSASAAIAANHRVELRAGDVVLAALNRSGANLEDCTFHREGTVTAYTESICEYDSGDLRLGAPDGTVRRPDGTDEQCIIDGSASCNPECDSTSCAGRCTSIVTSHLPLYSHLGCAPAGTVAVGAACTFTTGSDGDYDDCGGDAACVAGTCHALCSDSCGACAAIEGEPPELLFCM